MAKQLRQSIEQILEENRLRNERIHAPYNPLLGIGSLGSRYRFDVPDFVYPEMTINEQVYDTPLIRAVIKAGSLREFIITRLETEPTEELMDEVTKHILRVMIKWDFEFFAASVCIIADKDTGEEFNFVLRRPQRRLLAMLLAMFLAGKPTRMIILKARQWGGSTLVQIFIAWIQLFHKTRWNSLIVAHLSDISREIKGMYSLLLDRLPEWVFESGQKLKFSPFEGSQNTSILSERNCKVKLGSAENPNSARGASTHMVHCSEVGLWKNTEGRKPKDIVRSACAGIRALPHTVIIYESTADGVGSFFHQEWIKAKRGKSDKKPIFVPWFEIEMYAIPDADERKIAESIWLNPEDEKMAEYEQWLFSLGATLQGIAWYREEYKKYVEHGDMMAEYPSDDVEAFQNSGSKVFRPHLIERMRAACRKPDHIGYLISKGTKEKDALTDIRFVEESGFKSFLKVWDFPDTEQRIRDRYVVVVDIGGRSDKADYSVITVIDKYWMMYGGAPEVVARWYGHIDHDQLVWEAARIAKWYNDALLVFESNTLDTENTDGDHTEFILDTVKDYYDNLYSRTPADKIREGAPIKYGFHTNRATKAMIIDAMVESVRDGLFVERDDMSLDEFTNYEKKQNGSFGAIDGTHDDICMTVMIGNYVCYNTPVPKVVEVEKKVVSKVIVGEASF